MVVLALRAEVERAGTRLGRIGLQIEAWSGSTRFATARAAYRCLAPAVYRRVRTLAAAPAVPAPRRSADVPDADGTTSPVDVDSRHPTFFDHPVDHLPGILLVDAALKAAAPDLHAGATSSGWGFRLSFQRFAELGVPTTVTTTGRGAGEVEVVVAQPGGAVATGIVDR